MPAPPTELDPDRPADDRPTDHRVEWWYFFGEVHSVDPTRPGSWSFVSTLLKKRLPVFGWPTVWLAATQVMDTRAATRCCTGALPTPLAYDARSFSFQVRYGPRTPRWGLTRTPSAWQLEHQRKVALSLTLDDPGPPLPVGAHGIMQYGGGHALGWYMRPFLEARGTVVDSGRVVRVRGHAWMERQWGWSPVETFAWRYLTLRLADGRRILAFKTRVDGHEKTFGIHVAPEGTREIRGLHITPEAPGPAFAPRTRLTAPGLDLLVEALPCDQLIRPWTPGAPPFYEGFSRVRGTLDGVAVDGVGVTELRAPSRDFLERPPV